MGSGSHDYSLPDGGGIKRVVPKLADGREPTRRDYIAFEMLETERTYVFNMHTLIQVCFIVANTEYLFSLHILFYTISC
jgi:hypothetical protein